MYPQKSKPYYRPDGTYINSFGETPGQALERYRRQAVERYQFERYYERERRRYTEAQLYPETIRVFCDLIEKTIAKIKV
jgi:hypothetical protein